MDRAAATADRGADAEARVGNVSTAHHCVRRDQQFLWIACIGES